MLIALLLVLSAVKVNGESVDHDGLRRSRQLDLGLQDIRTTDEEIPSTIRSSENDEKILGYLPPVSSSLSPEVVSAQSQQTFEFKSVDSQKESEFSLSKIPKPSSELVPPFNHLEQDITVRTTAGVEEAKTTFASQTKFITTTEKHIFGQTPTQNIRVDTSTRPKAELNNAEATNELRSYLPPQPEFSAAAQTNVAVVQPANQNNGHDHDHHHGHHHHGDNFDICADAFHSFLCAPLKARKRITGAFPANLRGQSSFINYQKTLPNIDRETAPSNTFRSEYLPPNPSPTNLIPSTYSPLFTTVRPTTTTTRITTAHSFSSPKFIPEPSNDRFYLPPDNRIFNSPPFSAAPSNPPISTIKPAPTPSPTTISTPRTTPAPITTPVPTTVPSPTTSQPVTTVSSTFLQSSPSIVSTFPIFNSFPSSDNGFYLPPKPSPQPAASLVSTSNFIFPVTPTQQPSSTFVSIPTVTEFEFLPSNSIFVSQNTVSQPTFPVFTSTVKPITTFAPTTTFKPLIQYSPFAPQPSSLGHSYLPPVPSTPRPTTTTAKPTTPKLIPQPSNADRAYLPPDPKEPAAAQISSAAVAPPQNNNPFHHGRDLCTDPFHSFLCASAKPRKRITGQLPSGFTPESSNRNEFRLRPEPSSQDESKVLPEKSLQVNSAQNLGYKYPKPVNPLPTPSNAITSTVSASTGYSYPKPDKIFPLPSQQDFKIAPVITTTTKKPEPTFRASEAKAVGYQYPKPDKIFPLPGSQEITKVITTTNPPTTGYTYPKPQKTFPLPTERKEVQQKPPQSPLPQPTNQVVGYQYPKPEQSLKLPEKKGYSYPKPEKRLELPTESRPKSVLPQTKSSLDALRNLGSADFIPVNKIEFKRSESSKLIEGLRRFGERMKKREKEAQLSKGQLH